MDKRKIVVIYDTSYLMGEFQSVKKFIISRRFSSMEKHGLLGFMKAKQKVYHDPSKLFAVAEVVPNEVIKELDEQKAIVPKQLITDLLQDGALKVDLSQDTVVGAITMMPGEASGKVISRYAERLVTYGTREKYDLAIVATEDDELLAKLTEMAVRGKAVLGVKGEHLLTTRLLHDKLTEVANYDRQIPVVMEN